MGEGDNLRNEIILNISVKGGQLFLREEINRGTAIINFEEVC